MKKMILKMALVACILLGGYQALALDAADYVDIAKTKSYIGGAEEGELKVLPESYFQKNKKNKSEEVSEGF